MTKLKGVILSVEDVICCQGPADKNILSEVDKLISFFKSRDIEFVVFTNRSWTINNGASFEAWLKARWGDFHYFSRVVDPAVPNKPSRAATEYVLDKMKWAREETIYIGSSDSDMRTAVNGKLLFLRATWWSNNTNYGFDFDTPKNIARYIDTFCLREHLWCHEIKDKEYEFYALAPFSTYKREYTLYSEDARAAAKHGRGHPDFWVGALVSSLYFSGLYNKIDHIATYPGHKSGSGNAVMDQAVTIFGKCFRKSYLPDLIIRHTTATKSQAARNSGQRIDHLNQLNTIKLNPNPLRTETSRYKKSPLKEGKTVLVIDDICTNGYSLEAARKYVEETGANVICVSWLKTINTGIKVLGEVGRFDPYSENYFESAPIADEYRYHDYIVDHLAPSELTALFSMYERWDWDD